MEDSEWDLIESLAHQAGLSSARFDPHTLALSFIVQARNAATAAACAENAAVCLSGELGDIRVTGVRVKPQQAGTSYLYDTVDMPELVGHDEILRMCHGYHWFGIDDTQKPSFPRPTATTASGHLWKRSAVLAWIESGPHPA